MAEISSQLRTLWQSNIAMENPQFVYEFPIGKGECPLLILDDRSVGVPKLADMKLLLCLLEVDPWQEAPPALST